MKDVKSVWDTICRHSKILARGIARTVYGAATAGLIGLAIYGIRAIPSEQGWTAVCDFVATTATLVVALASVYWQGVTRKRGAWL